MIKNGDDRKNYTGQVFSGEKNSNKLKNTYKQVMITLLYLTKKKKIKFE